VAVSGSVISQGSQFGLGTWLLRYSREYEKQADILGAQMMARAGYDPRDLARVFENIEKQAGGGSPQWMSDSPEPGQPLGVHRAGSGDAAGGAFAPRQRGAAEVKSLMASLPAPKSMAQVEREANRGGGNSGGGDSGDNSEPVSVGEIGQPVPAPSTSYRPVKAARCSRQTCRRTGTRSRRRARSSSLPKNGYGQLNGQSVFTHGAEVGVMRAQSGDLSEATDAVLQSLASGNPELRDVQPPRQVQLSQRTAIHHQLTNRSVTGDREQVNFVTTFLADGSLFYYVTVVPANESNAYAGTFQRIAESIRLMDR
jgi:hypothetical protein